MTEENTNERDSSYPYLEKKYPPMTSTMVMSRIEKDGIIDSEVDSSDDDYISRNEKYVSGNLKNGSSEAKKPSLGTFIYQQYGWAMSTFITTLILLTHALFVWGQVAPLWSLSSKYQIDANISAISPALLNTLNLFGAPSSFLLNEEGGVLLLQFTYWDSVVELFHIGQPVAIASSILLFLFSAVWPHLKL
eukprot:Awhi_evm1s11224